MSKKLKQAILETKSNIHYYRCVLICTYVCVFYPFAFIHIMYSLYVCVSPSLCMSLGMSGCSSLPLSLPPSPLHHNTMKGGKTSPSRIPHQTEVWQRSMGGGGGGRRRREKETCKAQGQHAAERTISPFTFFHYLSSCLLYFHSSCDVKHAKPLRIFMIYWVISAAVCGLVSTWCLDLLLHGLNTLNFLSIFFCLYV